MQPYPRQVTTTLVRTIAWYLHDLLTSFYSAYNCFPNVLDYTSIVIPVTFADKRVDTVDSSFEPLTERDKVNMGLCMPLSNPSSDSLR